MPNFKKTLNLSELLAVKAQIEDLQFWRDLCPQAKISDVALDRAKAIQVDAAQIHEYQSVLRAEGYFQTPPMLPVEMQQEMLACIEAVKSAGFPQMFALVYDVFYEAFHYFDNILRLMLGDEYKMIPNFWIYYVPTTEGGKGFEPHRDLEYLNTIDSQGNPTVLTLWVTVTDANPLNSCMYVLPSHRDPEYKASITNLKQGASLFKLEDVRAIPVAGGALSGWDQYLYHWGSRGSQRASHARVSYALYCQRGDMAPVDDAWVDLHSDLSFEDRLGFICRGVYRYSYVKSDPTQQTPELLAFLEKHMKLIELQPA